MTALVLLGVALVPACVPVAGDRIVARDLAAAWPAFAALPAEMPLGYAPAPGARRVFSAAELARLSARHGIAGPAAASLCVERATAPLAPACVQVAGDRIVARDLAAAWPAFAALPAEMPLGYAPAPGARRVFSAAELARLAARHGIAAPPAASLCLERATAPLARERVLVAMRQALEAPDAHIEIVELSRYPVPDGELVFPRELLRAPAPGAPVAAPVFWRGEVRYAGGKRFPVWARVVVSARFRRVVAAVPLRAGEAIRAEQLRVEDSEGFPPAADAVPPEAMVGRRPRRSIPAGAAVPPMLLDAPREVERGDTVNVSVASGAARLSFTARAESAGRAGETVRVRNPESRRTFAARVAGKGAVEVNPGGRKP